MAEKLDRTMAGRVHWRERFIDWVGGRADETSVRRSLARWMTDVMYLGERDYDDLREGKRISAAQRELLQGMDPIQAARALEMGQLDAMLEEMDKEVLEKRDKAGEQEVKLSDAEEGAVEAGKKLVEEENQKGTRKLYEIADKYNKKLADIIEKGGTPEEIKDAIGKIVESMAKDISDKDDVQKVLKELLEKLTEQRRKDQDPGKDPKKWRMLIFYILLNIPEEIIRSAEEAAKSMAQ